MGMLSEFKEFAFKGNVVDLAVGVVIGGAFGKIVKAIVDDVIMPFVGILLPDGNWRSAAWTLRSMGPAGPEGDARLLWGDLVGVLVDFLVVAFVLFLAVRSLNRLKQQPAPKVGNNDETFDFDPKQWETTLKEFDRIMGELEQFVQSADDATLAKIAPNMARIAQHNAYHIGEMVTSRKKQGSWNPETGVK